MKPLIRYFLLLQQLIFFFIVWAVIDQFVNYLKLPTPAGVIGLFFVTFLLIRGVMAHRQIESGARLLLAEMPLFFIPPLLSITELGPFFAKYGLNLLVATMIGSAIVMGCTGLIVDFVFRLESRMRDRDQSER